MSAELHPYYERELRTFRQLAEQFSQQFPATAGRLLLETHRSLDPHVERLVQAFALLTARVQHKLDDEFPELTNALLHFLYPHYTAPVPAMGIVELPLANDRAKLPRGFTLERGSRLRTQPVDGVPCTFRTTQKLTCWPIAVRSAGLTLPPFPRGVTPPQGAAAVLQLRLESMADLTFRDLALDRLRFFLHGDHATMCRLYELLLNDVIGVFARAGDGLPTRPTLRLDPRRVLRPTGFSEEEGMLPYPATSFVGYRLLTEYFAFPAKFRFLELAGLSELRRGPIADGLGRSLELLFFVRQSRQDLEEAVGPGTFRLGCTPVVNLFDRVAEPIALDHTQSEYRVVSDAAQPLAFEVYQVDSVSRTEAGTGKSTPYRPFYGYTHDTAGAGSAFWYPTRRSSLLPEDRGSEVFLSLVDREFDPRRPADGVLTVRTTCSNRDLPMRLQLSGKAIDFELEAAAPVDRVRLLGGLTPARRPPRRNAAYWRLLSHLSLNHLSLTGGDQARDSLRELLRLYDFSDGAGGGASAQTSKAILEQTVEGITGLSSRRIVAQTGSEVSSGFCRGLEITLELDEEKFSGSGVFLFASMLERFLGLHASVNSFTQLVLRTGAGEVRRWPPRAGERTLA